MLRVNRLLKTSLPHPHLKHPNLKTCLTKCVLFGLLVFFLRLPFTGYANSKRRTVFRVPQLLEIVEREFVTSESIAALCDVAFLQATSTNFISETGRRSNRYSSSGLEGTKTKVEFKTMGNAKVLYVNEKLDTFSRDLVTKGRTFFISTAHVAYFVDEILPAIQQRFVLITHDGSYDSGSSAEVLNSEKLIRWYGTNMFPSAKTVGIPLGLQRNAVDFRLIEIARRNKKSKLLYISTLKHAPHSSVVETLRENGFREHTRKSWAEHIFELSTHKFSAWPEGGSVDSHNIWESLYLGVIPVVVRTPQLEPWFSSLPILWIDSFEKVTPTYLRRVRVQDKKWLPTSTLCTITSIKDALAGEL